MSMSAPELFQTADDRRHMICPIGGGEHTLCGIAKDAWEIENEPGWKGVPLTGKTVTCGLCARVIVECRKVRIATNSKG